MIDWPIGDNLMIEEWRRKIGDRVISNIENLDFRLLGSKKSEIAWMFNINNRPISQSSNCWFYPEFMCNHTQSHMALIAMGPPTPPKVVSNQRHRRPNFQLAQEFTISWRGGTEGLVWEKGRLTLQQNVQTTSINWHQHSTIKRLAIKPTWTFTIDSVPSLNKRDAFLSRAGWINELCCRSSQI